MTTCGRIFILLLSFIAFLLVAGCSSDTTSTAPKNSVPASVEAQAQQLIADLTAQGYEVTRGYFKLYTEEDCTYSYAQMKTCYGNNPAAPYVMFGVQPWPEEYIDTATNMAFGQFYPGYSGSFRLDPREAIVILGILPPPAAYFGLQTYAFTREGTFDTTSATYQYMVNNPEMLNTFFTKVPLNQNRIQIAASLSNSNNDVVVQQQSGAAFNQERFFIITPDQFMDSAVRQSLNRIAVNSSLIFTEPIPSVAGNLAAVKTGLDEHADDLFWIMRYSMPNDGGGLGTPSDTWKQNLPLIVLRVREKKTSRPVQTYQPVVYETRTGIDEGSLGADLAKLVAAVNAKWGQPCASGDCSDQGTADFLNLQEPPINFIGQPCMEIGMNCLGDSQDSSYQAAPGNLTLDHGEVYAVVGTLGTETDNATYVGLSVNDSLMVKGIANISGDELKGTAVSYAAGGINNIEKYYVYYFARNCSDILDLTGGNCLSVTEDMIPACSDSATQTCDYLKLAVRNYVVPGTRRGPEETLLQHPKLLKLTRK
ncbi:hypothetical protein [Geotalea uraniireducens]|uniref:Uncharacterized protein n=1 Tax=Geotalea uraniireducens (strain Rf4) TaxID=351605 RepID=A5G618_GEOUR|nr:hypothetical protein [Geotalea uraniireducens]ABQ27236.1 hypothetical protein Gura_3065 [Geotalea uraniireducens Rf4]